MEKEERDLLHFIMSTQFCSLTDLKQAFSLIKKSPDADEVITSTVDNINAFMKAYDFEIVRGKSDVSGEESVCLVNIAANSISEHVKFFEKKTILLFSKILHQCVMSDGFISDMACINLSSQADMSKAAAQVAINDLVSKRWLESEGGMIYLGVRSLSELGQLMTSYFPNEVKPCPLCNNVVCYGKTCNSCGVKGHVYCLEKFWKRSAVCPECKCQWPLEVPCVSEPTPVSDGEDDSEPSGGNDLDPSTAPSLSKRPRRFID